MKKIFFLTVLLLLGGCVSTEIEKHTTEDLKNDLPAVGNPPASTLYFNGDGNVEKSEVSKYYDALETYVAYVEGYMRFLGTQYDLSQYKLSAACKEALTRPIPVKPLPPIPDVLKSDDDEIIDVLIEYIGTLRNTIYSFNKQINSKLDDVNRYCPR